MAGRTRELAVGLRANAELAHANAESAADVNQHAKAGVSVAQRTSAKLHGLFGDVDRAASLAQDFEERIRTAHRVAEMIFSLVEKAHLLSLNASIEAARAGDAGRGFSVVAEEIRKLADSAETSAQQIQELVTDLESETRRIGKVTASMGGVARESRDQVDGVFRSLEQIQAAIEKCSERTGEIERQAAQQASNAEQALDEVERIAALVTDSVKVANEMQRSYGSQAEAVRQMVRQAGRLSEMSIQLEKVARRFRTR